MMPIHVDLLPVVLSPASMAITFLSHAVCPL
jgi:hypothetical protein